jgi:nifR3 family TIM-barrel protein
MYDSLPQPFFVLAPMEDVTDTVFRRVVARCAKPDFFVTEFTNADGLWSRGADEVAMRLRYTEEERPIVAQIWGRDPEIFYKTAQKLVEMGFDGIDVNFGCPERSVMQHACGAALIEEPELAAKIIGETIRGAGKLPVSVKTRIGVGKIVTEEWAKALLATGIAALAVHGRTAREMSKVPAHWDEIGKVVRVRDGMGGATKIIGNGDVKSRADGLDKAKEFGVDGIMIGRGIFDNPWIFSVDEHQPTREELLKLMLFHLDLFEKEWGERKPFVVLKKYFKIYIRDFAGASALRVELMMTKTFADARMRVQGVLDGTN